MFIWLVCNVHNLIKAAKRLRTELPGNGSGFSKLSGFKNIFNGEIKSNSYKNTYIEEKDGKYKRNQLKFNFA